MYFVIFQKPVTFRIFISFTIKPIDKLRRKFTEKLAHYPSSPDGDVFSGKYSEYKGKDLKVGNTKNDTGLLIFSRLVNRFLHYFFINPARNISNLVLFYS
jgi:hypothetical protein